MVDSRLGHSAVFDFGSTWICTLRDCSNARYVVSLGGMKVRNVWLSFSRPVIVSSPMVTSAIRPACA